MMLEKAQITNTRTGAVISVMFNPEEYTLETGNAFAEIAVPGLSTPPIQYVRGNARTLTTSLFFDSYETRADVRGATQQIVRLLEQDPMTKAPPILLFIWGSLSFQCVLENVIQKFTMFLEDGTPVRATLEVSFREYEAIEISIEHGLFIGPPTVRTLLEGQTLSGLAGDVTGDPGAWRDIADANDVDDPRNVPAGGQIVIPPRE